MSTAGQKGVMSVVYGVIVVAIMAVFIIQFRPNASQRTGSLSQQCVVTVRDRCVDPKEFWASLSLAMPRGLDESQIKRMGLRRQVIEGLLERTVLVQDAERLKLTISEDDINKQLVRGRIRVSLPVQHAQMLAFSLNMPEPGLRLMSFENPTSKAFDYKVYQRTIKTTTNRSEKEFKHMQREELVAERMRELVRSRARVTDDEAFASYVREKSTAQIDYVRLRRPWVVARYLDTSAKAIAEWSKDHTEDIAKSFESRKSDFAPGCRKSRHILIRLKSDTQPDAHDKEEAAGMADKALARIRGGEDFASVASELSEDEGSASRGGELPCFKKDGKMVKPFEDAVFGLKNAGDVSDKVETQYGIHIVQLIATVAEDPTKAEADAKAIIAADLMRGMKADQLMSDAAKQILRSAQEGKSLADATDEALKVLDGKYAKGAKAADKRRADAAKAEGKDKPEETPDPNRPKVESTGSFTPDGRPIPEAARDQNVAALAFKLDKPGAVAPDLVRTEDGYAVIQLKDKKAATREQYDKERDEYVSKFQRAKAQEMLVDYINRLKAKARAETRINEAYAKAPDKDKGEAPPDEGGGED